MADIYGWSNPNPTSLICLCTMDEFMDGHRCRCPDHLVCGECEADHQEADYDENAFDPRDLNSPGVW
jgi:hypothetical protein